MIRQHLFSPLRHASAETFAAINKALTPGDFHLFLTTYRSGTPEQIDETFKKFNLELVYKSPACYNFAHPERNGPSQTLWVFKTKEAV